jgi:hypothetical protein
MDARRIKSDSPERLDDVFVRLCVCRNTQGEGESGPDQNTTYRTFTRTVRHFSDSSTGLDN